jgi:hypothetical protein
MSLVVLRQLAEPLGTGGTSRPMRILRPLRSSTTPSSAPPDADYSRFPGIRWSNPLVA